MTKRFFPCLCAALLCLLLCAPGAPAEAPEAPCYAFASWMPEMAAALDVPAADAQRLYRVDILGADAHFRYLLLPEDNDLPAPQAATPLGIRLFFDEPPAALWEDQSRILSIDLPQPFVTPTRVAFAGTVAYGIIRDIGHDGVVLDLWHDPETITDISETISPRYAITRDTIQYYFGTPFAIGDGCMLIVDETNTALAMFESNG